MTMTQADFWARFDLSAELSPLTTTLQNSRILLIGAGGLGNDLAIRLAGARIGALTLVDGDTVSVSNLPHSTLFLPDDVGRAKVHVVRDYLNAKYPALTVHTETQFVQQISQAHFAQHDLIICAPDNDQTRRWVNYYAVKNKKPALYLGVSGNKAEWTGYTYLYKPDTSGCFTCFATGGDTGGESFDAIATTDDIDAARNKCGGENVAVPMLSPVVGVMAGYAAVVVMKALTAIGNSPTYTYIDLKRPGITTYDIQALSNCTVCGQLEEYDITPEFLARLAQQQKENK